MQYIDNLYLSRLLEKSGKSQRISCGLESGHPVKVICIAPRHEHTLKALRYGTRSQGFTQFYLQTPPSSANRINHTCPFLTDPEGWKAELASVAGYIPDVVLGCAIW